MSTEDAATRLNQPPAAAVTDSPATVLTGSVVLDRANLVSDSPQPVSTAHTQQPTSTAQETPRTTQPPAPTTSTIEAGNDSDATTRAKEGTQGQDQATDSKTKQEAGNVPPLIPAANSGQSSPPLMAFGVPLARGPDGKLYNPAKGPPPEPTPKRQTIADLKSPKPSVDNDLERRDTRIGGLADIPKSWGKLPPSVTLGVEIGWVQSERLLVVKEQANGGVKVDLSKASVPAPSMSALSWLETSIRSYAKFIEVASKQASSGQDEAEFIRRERMAIGEIRSILSEMMPQPKS